MKQKQLITMTQKESERYEIIRDLIAKKIDGTEASKLLCLSIRQAKRLKASVSCLGVQGVIHGIRGKNSHNKTSPKILAIALRLGVPPVYTPIAIPDNSAPYNIVFP